MDRPTNLMVVNGLMGFEGPVDYELAKQAIWERLVERFPRFRQRVSEPLFGAGLPSWEDDPDFDLDLHVHRRALPAPGDDDALRRLAGELVAAPLDPAKPLWDMYLIEGYGSGTALIARMHHCIADGIALAHVLLSLTTGGPELDLAPPADVGTRHISAGAALGPARDVALMLDAAVHEGFEMLAHPAAETRAFVDGVASNARALAKLLLTGPDTATVLKEAPGVARRVTWCEPVPLEEIKAVGHAHGATVNDVVLTAMTGALRRYLEQRNSLVDEIRAVIPFNLRPLDQPLPAELGNRFGLVELPLPIAMADARARLAEVHRRMQQIKDSPEGPLSYRVLGLIGRTPPPVERRILDLMSRVETVVITNVPGPRQPVYFAGAKLTSLLAWVPTGGSIGIGVSVISYDGAVTVALQTAASIIPDPDQIVAAFAQEMHDLMRLQPHSPRPKRAHSHARSRPSTAIGPPG